MAAVIFLFLALALVARPCKPYTDPEGIKLLQDLRNFKGDAAPQSWEGHDPCGSLWEGVECSADGHVLNVVLSDWLPQRQLLQLLTDQETSILEKAIGVTGTVGDINAAIGRNLPAGSGDSDASSQFVAPTIAAIKSGLESLLPFATSGHPVIPSMAPIAASPLVQTPSPSEAPSALLSSIIEMSPAGMPAASGSSSPSLAPSMADSGQGSRESSQSTSINTGEALSELLTEIELIKEKLRMQANAGRKLLAKEESLEPSADRMMSPAGAPVMQALPTIASPPAMPISMPMTPDSAAGQPPEAMPIMAPLGGVDPEFLPEGDTDIMAVQAAVGNDKGIGRRLMAALQISLGSPAPGPEGSYKEVLAPESAPAGLGSPAKVDSKITKYPDGSTSVQLGEGSIGNFTLPTINGTIPEQKDVKLIFGRRMLQDIKPASTLLDFSTASAPVASSKPAGPAQGPANGPSEGGYQEVLAPKSAPTGESSPEASGLPVKLPPLQVGPFKLPAINSTIPQKQEPGSPGRRHLQEDLQRVPGFTRK